MPDHAVIGAYRKALHMPRADDRLARGRLGESPVVTESLDDGRELGGGGHVAAEDASWAQHPADGVHALPGGEHVENGTIDAPLGALLRTLVERRRNILVIGGTGSGKTTDGSFVYVLKVASNNPNFETLKSLMAREGAFNASWM